MRQCVCLCVTVVESFVKRTIWTFILPLLLRTLSEAIKNQSLSLSLSFPLSFLLLSPPFFLPLSPFLSLPFSPPSLSPPLSFSLPSLSPSLSLPLSLSSLSLSLSLSPPPPLSRPMATRCSYRDVLCSRSFLCFPSSFFFVRPHLSSCLLSVTQYTCNTVVYEA